MVLLYSNMLFFSIAFMFSEVLRRTTLSILAVIGILVASMFIGGILSKIPSDATVNSIILRMHTSFFGTTATNIVGFYFCPDNSWTEIGITWNNAPSISGLSVVSSTAVASADEEYDIEVTLAVKGKTIVTLVLRTLQPTSFLGWAAFDSKEGSQVNSPRLVVEYTMPSPPLDLGILSIIAALVVVSVVVVVLVYRFAKGKKKPPPPSPSVLHFGQRVNIAPSEKK